MLHLKVVFAERPHARIRAIDTAAAMAHPGVVAVLTAEDVPSNGFGLIVPDQPVLCGEVVRCVGDRVALVAAETPDAAEAAARLVVIDYEDLPVISDPHAALQTDAPLLHLGWGTNIISEFAIRKGDTARAFAEADVIVEDEFSTTWQEHAFLQPEAGIAYVDEHERVIIETAGQWLHEDRRQIATMLQLPEERIVVRYAAVGGAFGGREDLSLQHLLALAAWKLRRTVAMNWSREESMIGHPKRHPVTIRSRWAARRDGTITAVEAHAVADGGAYASTSQEVIKVIALFASGTYEVPNITSTIVAAYTNNLPTGAFRGFGAPQAQFAAEMMITKLAHALGIDPLDMRRRNIYREGGTEPTQVTLPPGVSALPVLERCIAEAHTRMGHEPPAAPYLRRGIGIAAGIKNLGYSFGYPEQATAAVELYGDASINRAVVRVGAAEVGQGTHTALRQIAAEVLQVPFERIEMICDDSSAAPNAGSASASRLTLIAGRAVHDAARAALQQWHEEERPACATVQYRPPATTPLDPVTTAGRPNYAYGYASQAVEVEVHLLTGQVQVLRAISVHDVGRVINPQQVTGQIEGGVVQALGYALLEQFQMRDGYVTTPHFSSYLLPTTMDVPEIIPIALEHAEPLGPFGARGFAELPLVPFAPAVAIAVYNAIGVWLTRLPMTPERVLEAIKKQHTA
ncbi:MAG: xanthine dehydrogenase family protein [Chloroflexaceae bacterium]|nr:xanthine dehydrogenase family protein [Chloroflexaceae bacterium]